MAPSQSAGQVRPLTLTDLAEVLGAGIRDFRAAPMFGLVLASLCIGTGWLLFALLFNLAMPYLAYPLAMGFALIAPFVALGLYVVSDNLEHGRPNTWSSVATAIRAAARRDVRWMALITGFILVIWMDIAAFTLFAFVGMHGFSPDFLDTILTTPSGLAFLIIGNLAGAAIAFGVFSICVISFPMLYEHDIDFVTAMLTSVRLVAANLQIMLVWCGLIGILVVLSLASMLIGLLVVLPVIGHATWHLYRRTIVPAQPHDAPGGIGRVAA